MPLVGQHVRERRRGRLLTTMSRIGWTGVDGRLPVEQLAPVLVAGQPVDTPHRAATHGYAALMLSDHGCIFRP